MDRLDRRFDNLYWMKLSEIARYWAAKELTAAKAVANGYELSAPFACPEFTIRMPGQSVSVTAGSKPLTLEPVSSAKPQIRYHA